MARVYMHGFLLIFVIVLTVNRCQCGHLERRAFLDRVRRFYRILTPYQQYRVHCLINTYRRRQRTHEGRVSWLTIASQIADLFCQACNSMGNPVESDDCRLRFCAAT